MFLAAVLTAAGLVIIPNPMSPARVALAADAMTEATTYTTNIGTSLGSTARATAVQSDGKILVGGAFTGFLRRFNANGTTDSAFNTNASTSVTNEVTGVGVQSDGKIIVVGGTVSVSGFVKRLNSDGTLDAAFNTNVGNTFNTQLVRAIEIQSDGRIVVGGDFSGRLKRLTTTGTLDSTFNTNIGSNLNGAVHAISIQRGGTDIVVTGAFSGYLKRFLTTGLPNTGFNTNVGSALDGIGYGVAFLSSWAVVVGGSFTGKLKRFTNAGVLDSTYNTAIGSTIDNTVYGVAADVGSYDGVVVGGAFTGKLRRFAADGAVNGSMNTTNLDGDVRAVNFPCSQILITGEFTGGSKRYAVDQDWAWSPIPSDTTLYAGCLTPKNATRTKTLSNGLQASISVSGANATIWEVDRTFSAPVVGGLPGQFFNDQLLDEYAVRLNAIGTGCAPGALCTNRGTVTVTFSDVVTNPIISLAAIGGAWTKGTGWTELDVTTPGATLTKLSGTNIQVINGTHIEPVTKNPNIECDKVGNPAPYGQTATAACGSIQVNGSFSSVTFSLSVKSRSNTANSDTSISFTDAFIFVVHVREDFGLAPLSYDSPAASHVVGSLKLGASVTPDQTSLIYPTTNADAVAAGAVISNVDDGVSVWGTSVNVGQIGHTYTVPISLIGVTDTAKLCGWIDFNRDGDFDLGERACAADIAVGATTANLAWTVPVDASAGATYARVRLSYSDVSSPTGKVDSGEVEDYSLTTVIAPAAAPPYQLSYNLGGGTGTTPTTVTNLQQGNTTSLVDDTGFTRSGFTFSGWNCDNSIGAKAAGTTATQPAANVVCTAQWAAVTVAPPYQLSYNLGGGTGTTPTTVTNLQQGDTTSLASGSGFTKTGFTFTGWNCDNSIGRKAAASTATQPAANVVCTAQWTAVVVAPTTTYQLSYDLGGGTGTTPTTETDLNQGDTTTLVDDTGFTKTGFTFTGWNCDNSIGAKAAGTTATQPAADVVCTAQWTAVTVAPPGPPYQLSYDLGGGTGTTPATAANLQQGDTTTIASGTGITKTGFTFTGWNCDNSIGAKAAGTTATQPAANVVCTAQWTAVTTTTIAVTTPTIATPTYQLSYELGGGTGTTPTTVTGLNKGDATTIANGTGITKTGFTFTGWNCDNSIGNKAAGTTATQPAANVVCTAQWTAVTAALSPLPTTGLKANLGLQIAILVLMVGFVLLLLSHRFQRRWL
jgi:uncharacterized delta-60 repeat protein/uncharacterized repeat protein (TIGR02543 family)